MDQEYYSGCFPVNYQGCFTGYTLGCSIAAMNFGQRLKAARDHAGLTQADLEAKSGVGQQAISKIERSNDQDSSLFTVQLALACGVRPEWLALGEGPMVSKVYARDERISHVLRIMEELPDYALDQAVREVDSIAELIDAATRAAEQEKTGS